MAKTAVAANLHQTGNVLPHLAAKVALGGVVSIDVVTNLGDLVLRQVLDASGGVNTGLRANLGCGGLADAVKVGKSDLDTLVTRKVDAIDTGQRESPLSYLALTLLVARVLADYVYLAVATNDLALVAHLLYRRTYLHVSFLPVDSTCTGSASGLAGGAAWRSISSPSRRRE